MVPQGLYGTAVAAGTGSACKRGIHDYGARRKVDLVGPPSVYLNQHESLKQTARVLRVHANTVAYRIQRIERLTALDRTDPDHRLSAHVATKIVESHMAGSLPI